jgi:hypothetical protein
MGRALAIWGVVYLTAWYYAYTKALELQAAGYRGPASCYIATAASYGHAGLVGPHSVIIANGKQIRITQQLLTLKCGELAIQTAWPHFHVFLRQIYNTFGPPLARRLVNPFLADIAYLTLKPFEWMTSLILKSLVPEIDEYARRLYCVSEP